MQRIRLINNERNRIKIRIKEKEIEKILRLENTKL